MLSGHISTLYIKYVGDKFNETATQQHNHTSFINSDG